MAHPPDKKRRNEKRERKRRQSLDGDGSWRLTTGERRKNERRAEDQEDPLIMQFPFLENIWDDESDGISPANTASTTDTDMPDNAAANDSSTPDSGHNRNDNQHNDAISEHNRLTEEPASLDADTVSNTDSNSAKRKPLPPEEKARLASLKNMLDASNARYQQASRNRPPVFAAGIEVKVINGEHAGKHGTVLDADYIENRALVSLPDEESPHWIAYKSLGHPD